MANLNKVLLIGNLTRDVDLRYSPTGVAVARMGMAINRYYSGQNGERKEETCFIDVVVFGKTAENCNTYLSKGKPVFVEGRLSLRTWETPEGEKKSRHEVIAERVQFLGGPRPGEERVFDEELESDESEDDIPF